jgi:hypothetical protein
VLNGFYSQKFDAEFPVVTVVEEEEHLLSGFGEYVVLPYSFDALCKGRTLKTGFRSSAKSLYASVAS